MNVQKVMVIIIARNTQISRVFSRLLSLHQHVTPEHVQKTNNDLPNFNIFEKNASILQEYGFKAGQIHRICASPHNILNLNERELMSNLKNWLTFGLSDKLLTVITSEPELITLNPSFVNHRYEELMTMFAKKDIHKLLMTCPRVFLDDFATIQDKVSYIVHSMGVEQKSIVKAAALQFDFQHIRCRHQFLQLAGYYKVTKNKFNPRNPPLNKILSRNIDTFLKLSGLSLEEYAAFCECFDEIEDMDDDDNEMIDE